MKHLKKYNENMYDQQMRDEQENDPNWGKPKITQIGHHIFYGEKT